MKTRDDHTAVAGVPVRGCGTTGNSIPYLNVSKSKVKLIAAQHIQIWVEGAQRQVSRDAKSSGLMRSPSAPGAHRDPRCCSPVALALCLRPRPHLRCSEHVATQARGRNPADPQSYLERFLARGRRGPSSSSTSSSDTARQQTLSSFPRRLLLSETRLTRVLVQCSVQSLHRARHTTVRWR